MAARRLPFPARQEQFSMAVRHAFLLGDAVHIHSPAGGQGMNTGIGDAINLAWKLPAVLAGHAPDKLLDSYEAERIGFARRLVATRCNNRMRGLDGGPWLSHADGANWSGGAVY